MSDDLKDRLRAVAMRRLLLGPPLGGRPGGRWPDARWAERWMAGVLAPSRPESPEESIYRMEARISQWVARCR